MLVRISSGRQFEAVSDATLLDAAQVASITLPYSCKTGRCSTCKGKVLEGTTRALHDELGLTPAEREAGWILTCVRAASTDVRLEIEDLGAMVIYPARTFACRIQSLHRLAPDVVKVLLRFPPAVAPQFHAGQYVDVIGPGSVRRSYSIANAPSPDKLLELHIRQVPGGAMSDYWFGAAKVNDLLRINGPLGTFVLGDVADRDVVFLATGTGIAPVKAMLEALNTRGSEAPSPRSVTVYWGGRRREDIYCGLPDPGGPFRFVPVLSRATADLSCTHGHVQDVALTERSDWTRAVVFACGSDAMIHSARDALQAAGLDSRNFHSDAFVCSAAA
jgi:CDP-4-dehydro-6-deoxyglucose reductase